MLLSPMKYGDYTWPHNPRVYEIVFSRNIVSHKVPFGCYILQDIGREHRVLRGEGEFCGEGAYEEFKKLACMFYKSEPQVLVHPVWQSARAWFVHLALKQEPREDFVSYEFEFWECFDEYRTSAVEAAENVIEPESETKPVTASAERESYTLKYGDTLWGLAYGRGLSIGQLLELNPQIRNPNVYYVGDVIYLS
ncbi:MAG: LysM peptidoglycan-binding domain-containing protein [Oscillospiraceae bacterium]